MRRVPELDGLRGIAAVMVICLHLGLAKSAPILGSAVDLFFVLSGYLITRILLEHDLTPRLLAPFYARRILRIWPIYYALLLGFLAINPFLPHHQRTTGFAYYLTYTQFLPRYWMARPPRFCAYFGHTWTLAAEEQFYLIWPLVGVLFGRRALLAAVPVLIGSAFVARLWLWPMLLVTTWDGFALGALLAWASGAAGSARSRRPVLVSCLAIVGSAALAWPLWRGPAWQFFAEVWPERASQAVGSLGTSATFAFYFSAVGLVVAFAGHPLLRPLRHPSLTYLGTISYGLYLFHLPLFAMISPTHYTPLCRDSMALDALKLAAVFVVAVVSWEFVEKPILRLKDRVPYDRREVGGDLRADGPGAVSEPHESGRAEVASRVRGRSGL